MQKIRTLILRHREVLTYLFFGGLTTLVNIAGYWLLSRAGLSTAVANAIALALSILFAYVTNRRWVFQSKTRGRAALAEFGKFIACRIGTGVADELIMILGVDVLGPSIAGPALMEPYSLLVKILANILVILLNYIFSKLLIFAGAARGE